MKEIKFNDIKDFYYKYISNLQNYACIEHVISAIINQRDSEVTLDCLQYRYFKDGYKIYQHININRLCTDIKKCIDGFKPEPSVGDMVMSLYGYNLKYKKLTEIQKTELFRLISILEGAKFNVCEHKVLGVIPLLYGGGFTRTIALPEIICPACWLNVTLCKPAKELGLKISKRNYSDFHKFVKECMESSLRIEIQSSSEIKSQPKEIYVKSQKFLGKYKIEIIDKALFESKSGV